MQKARKHIATTKYSFLYVENIPYILIDTLTEHYSPFGRIECNHENFNMKKDLDKQFASQDYL